MWQLQTIFLKKEKVYQIYQIKSRSNLSHYFYCYINILKSWNLSIANKSELKKYKIISFQRFLRDVCSQKNIFQEIFLPMNSKHKQDLWI